MFLISDVLIPCVGFPEFENGTVALGAYVASVNFGDKAGVRALMKELMPWISFVWCMAHRLELAIKEALKDNVFKDVDDMLLKIFYLYQKSPKKLRELKVI